MLAFPQINRQREEQALPLRRALLTLTIVSILALALAFAIFVATLLRAQTAHSSIAEVREFAAAITPPPLYPLEAINAAYVLVESSGDVSPIVSRYEANKKAFYLAARQWRTSPVAGSAALRSLLDAQIKASSEMFEKIERDLIPAVRRGQQEAAQFMLPTLQLTIGRVQANAEKLNAEVALEAVAQQQRYAQTLRLMGFGSALLTLLGAGALFAVNLRLSRRIIAVVGGEPAALARAARDIAAGDLRVQFEFDERYPASLGASFAGMQHQVKQSVARWKDLGGDIGRVVDEVGMIAERTQQGALSQQQRISRTKEDLDLVRDKVAQMNERNAQSSAAVHAALASMEQAASSSVETLSHLESLSATVREVIQVLSSVDLAMQRVDQSSQLIDGVAQRTRLLSLNAAIEAARAGEYGRGFSVVADEVRTLSEHSQQATREIRDVTSSLIENLKALRAQTRSALATADQAIGGAAGIREASRGLERSAGEARGVLQRMLADSNEHIAAVGSIGADVDAIDSDTHRSNAQITSLAERIRDVGQRFQELEEALASYQVA
ncbi:methyl-accepting chemotaxis protein [Niveibacterium terrae]|uniref:methyl-accepting chemotaxis protein n=1 Tax=Niveibacterium terrae TaxID=3373598 RepID=UPI003A8D53EA